jgi:LPXTG-motif cell wall-anchored protein
MQGLRRRIAALAVAGLLAAPSAAMGQSAGDDQYQDPFAGEDQSQTQPEPEPAEPEPAPADPAAPPPEPAAEAPPPAPAQAPAGQPAQLPYTGFDAGLIVLAGAVLLAGGVALRLRVRARS